MSESPSHVIVAGGNPLWARLLVGEPSSLLTTARWWAIPELAGGQSTNDARLCPQAIR